MVENSVIAVLTISKLQIVETDVNIFSCVINRDRIMRVLTGVKKASELNLEDGFL